MSDKALIRKTKYSRIAAAALASAMLLCQVSSVTAAPAGVRTGSAAARAAGANMAADARDADSPSAGAEGNVSSARQENTGFFTQTVKVEGVTRTVRFYLPEGAFRGAYFTVIAPPKGVDAETFIEENGWKAFSDKYGEGLLMLEPEKNDWGRSDNELRYIEAALSAFTDDKAFSSYGCCYLVGYDAGGTALQMYAMAHPDMVIGASFIRAFDISEKYMSRMAARADGKTGGAPLAGRAVPVLLYDETAAESTDAVGEGKAADNERTEAVAKYWIDACHAELVLDSQSKSCHVRTYTGRPEVIIQSNVGLEIPISVFTDCTEEFIKGAVIKGHESVLRKLTRGSYFLSGEKALQRRMDINRDCDVFSLDLDGVIYECIAFIPDSVKYSGKLSPVVYLFGDYTEPGNVLLDKLSFRTFAENAQTIVIVPCVGLSGEYAKSGEAGSSALIEEGNYGQLVSRICAYVNEAYPVDAQRSMAVIYEEGAGENAQADEEASADARASIDANMPADESAPFEKNTSGSMAFVNGLHSLMLKVIFENLPENIKIIILSDWSLFPAKYEAAFASFSPRPEGNLPDTDEDYSAMSEKEFGTAENSSGTEKDFGTAENSSGTENPSGTSAQLSGISDEEAVRVFVKRLYKSFLGREAEKEGLDEWVDVLANGNGTASEAVYGFFFSTEFQENPLSSREYITALYDIIFQRSPEKAELDEWMNVLNMGCTRKKILEGFLNSPEMKAFCEKLGIKAGSYYSDEYIDRMPDITAYVNSLYRQVLHRRATDAELETWGRLIAGGYPASRAAMKFFLGNECEWTLLSDFDFISELYSVTYRHVPDMEAFALWLRAFRGGTTREDAVKAVLGEELSPQEKEG